MPEPQPTIADRLRVLVVEDDASNRDVLRIVLELAGHTVHTAATGVEALRCAAEEPPDTVLLDLTLPDQNGEEVSAALRRDMDPAPRIIITSGVSLKGGDAARLGADAILQKPFDPDRLLELLSSRS